MIPRARRRLNGYSSGTVRYRHGDYDSPSAGSQYDLFYFSSLIYGNSYFSSLMFGIFLVCRRPSQLPPMSFQIFIAAGGGGGDASGGGSAIAGGLRAAQRRFQEAAEDVRARRHPAAATTLRAALS